eukprot:365675-Chlamydomonas_euryale.AAC.9
MHGAAAGATPACSRSGRGRGSCGRGRACGAAVAGEGSRRRSDALEGPVGLARGADQHERHGGGVPVRHSTKGGGVAGLKCLFRRKHGNRVVGRRGLVVCFIKINCH